MIDQTSQFFAILTTVGEAKHAAAIASGQDWTFTDMGVGDANGTDPIPDRLQTELINEWHRAPLNQVRVDPVNPNIIITEQIIPPEVGGLWIREIGLYDSDGDLVAVANCAPSYKPLLEQGTGKTQVVRMNFIVTSSANIVLKIDPAVVLATREYVDLKIQEELARLDHKQSVRVAATAAISLSNVQTIDGVAVAVGDRVLVTAQAQAQENGIYVVSAETWTRAIDADSNLEVTPGLFVHVEQGSVNGDSLWQLVTDAPITLDSTPLQFQEIAGASGVSAGTFRSVTVDTLGRVIAGTNPTTLAGYGITDALAAAENLGDLADVAQARDNLGLGSAATVDVQGSLDDATPGALMPVGAFGLGGTGIFLPNDTDLDTVIVGGLYRINQGGGVPEGMDYSPMLVIRAADTVAQILVNYTTGTIVSRAGFGASEGVPTFGAWTTSWNSSNFDPASLLVDATEAVKGITRYATAAETISGNGATAVTPLGLQQNTQNSVSDDTPGKYLKTGAYGWGQGGIILPEGTDLNTILDAGLYRVNSGPNVPPGGEWSPMLVLEAQDTIAQIVIHNQTGTIYSRGCALAAGFGPWVTNWNSGNFNPAAYQPALGFTPVQQGGGTGQATNKVYIGHRPAMADVGLQVDTTDFGAVWCDTYGVEKVRSAVASFTVGQVGTYGLFKVSGGWPTVPGTWVTGASLVYTDCEGESSHGSPAGSWMLMGGILNADGVADDSVSLFLRGI